MGTSSKVGSAREQGYKVVNDDELLAITEGRVRQLEGELAGHRGLLEEMEADPHLKDDPESAQNPLTQTRQTVESLQARLTAVLHPRLDALRANLKAAREMAEKADPPAS